VARLADGAGHVTVALEALGVLVEAGRALAAFVAAEAPPALALAVGVAAAALCAARVTLAG